MVEQFWTFIFYSFLGYLLEKAFAWATRAHNQRRKCFLLLPLCPVYGLGMLALLAVPPAWRAGPWLIVTGAVVTTAVEYAVHWDYETFLGVRFWDYSQVRSNLNGRVCLSFTLAWGVLSALAVWGIQPLLTPLAAAIPPGVTYTALLIFTLDAVYTARYLSVTGNAETLGLRAMVQSFSRSQP